MKTHRIAVAVADGYPVAMDPVRAALDGLGEVAEASIPRRPLAPAEIERYGHTLDAVDAILARAGIFNRDLLRALPRLKIIAVHGAGVDQVDLDAATQHGIVVTSAPGANANSVAELVIGFVIALLRRIPDGDRHVRVQGGWREERFVGRELRGKVVGLVGIGNVGRRVALLLQAFGVRVLTYDPYVDEAAIPPGVARAEYGEILRRADIISFHVPLTPETRNMFDARALEASKPGVIVLNTSRGGVVDENVLADGLAAGRIAGAALDVFAVEPPTSRHRVLDQPNLITSPHIGGSTVESLENVARVAAEEIARFLRGEQPRYVANPQVLVR